MKEEYIKEIITNNFQDTEKKIKKNRVLYVGNGFNCLNEHFILWDELMAKLFSSFGFNFFYKKNAIKNIPASLQYEILLNLVSNEKGWTYEKTDQEIQGKIYKLTCNLINPNELHDIAVRNYDEIITPNYDLCFEAAAYGIKSCVPATLFPAPKKEYPVGLFYDVKDRRQKKTKYKPVADCRCKRIWHPHSSKTGKENGKKKLCLQFDRYIANTSKLRSFFNTEKDFVKVFAEQLKKENLEREDYKNWGYCFLFADVDILASSLSYEELDFWWILSFRKKMLAENKISKNKIRYFRWTGKNISDEEIALETLLSTFDIEIVNVKEYLEEKLKEEGEVNVVQELSKIEDDKTSAINYIKFYKLCMNCDDENHKIKEFL